MRKIFFIFIFIGFSFSSSAVMYEYSIADRGGYLEERSVWGYQFSVERETFYPESYVTLIDDSNYTDFFSQGLELNSVKYQFKRNFPFVSLGLGFSYGIGNQEAANELEISRTVEFSVSSLSVEVILDGLMKEPYVVPYLSAGIYRGSYKEEQKSTNQKETGNTSFSSRLGLGLQMQLDFIDKDRSPSFLKNTFLFAEIKQYGSTEGKTNLVQQNYSLGLRLEF